MQESLPMTEVERRPAGAPGLAGWSRTDGLCLALSTVLLTVRVLLLAVQLGPWLLIDDAFISFRYAANLARGLGLVFNAGERVEGYTNFLWTVLLAAAQRLGVGMPAASTVLAFLATAGTLVLLVLLGRRLFADAAEAASTAGEGVLVAIAPLLFAAIGAQARYVVSGMETPLFVFLATLGVYLYLEARPPLVAGLVLALASLTRPEGAIFFGLVVLCELAVGGAGRQSQKSQASGEEGGGSRHVRGRLATAGWLAAGFLAVAAPYFIWRFAYYGDLLPNTFYAKAGGGGFNRALLLRGWTYLRASVHDTALGAPLVLALIGAIAGIRRDRRWLLPVALVIALGVYIVGVGGDFGFFFGPRFLLPALPFVLLLAAEGVRALAALSPPSSRRAIAGAGLAVLVALALVFSWPRKADDLKYVSLINESWTELGRWLRAESPPEAVVAVGAVGRIPFYSQRPTIDMLGLTDAHIAHLAMPLGKGMAGHEKFDMGYVLGRRPDYLVFVLLDPRGRPTLAQWKQYGGAIEAAYEMVALVKASEQPGPWVLETSSWTPELGQRGYQAAVYRRRQAPANGG